MSRSIYAVGDRVKLKPDPFRREHSSVAGEIMGILPSDHGNAQYRIRIDDERFERRILASEIDSHDEKGRHDGNAIPRPEGSGAAWFVSSSIRTKK